MRTDPRTTISIAILCLYALAFVGYAPGPSSTASTSTSSEHDDHDHDEHDHDHDEHDHDDHEGHDHDDDDGHDHGDHEGHDHPAHGPNGGHMVNLSGGSHAEWAHDDEEDLITVYVEKPEAVTKVQMKTKIEAKETVYDFEKEEVDGKAVYQLVSPELLTAVKMGKGVDTTLVISTDEGDATGQVEHHAH